MAYLRHLISLIALVGAALGAFAQINTDQVLTIGRNALYFEDYLLSIQYFNRVIDAKPYMAEPYFYRAIAKLNLEDYQGAEDDCTLALDRNPFKAEAYHVRGVARQTLHKDKEAITDYNKALEIMPENQSVLMNKAVCEENLKDYEASAGTYATLMRLFPKFDRAYLGRAKLKLAQTDTIAALSDINRSIELSKNNSTAYVMRAEIEMKSVHDIPAAIADMDEAIKLEPHFAGYFLNRAFMKYKNDDYFGAMSDYDYALVLEPTNVIAHFNRGLLLAEVSDNDKALRDFSYVLKSNPNHFMARYNRALIYTETGELRKAIADYDIVLQKYPDFQAGLYARSECKRKLGDMAGGEADYRKSMALRKKKQTFAESTGDDENNDAVNLEIENESAVMNKFNTLVEHETDSEIKPEYDNRSRGRVQDTDFRVELEPAFFLSFYDVGVSERTHYIKEVTEINDSRLLSHKIHLTNKRANLGDKALNVHFAGVDYYLSLLANSTPRAIDYFGLGMEYLTLRNYGEAIHHFSNAIEKSGKFAAAYFARANARLMQHTTLQMTSEESAGTPAIVLERQRQEMLLEVIADLDSCLRLSPKNAYAHFNKAIVYDMLSDYTAAVRSLTSAIEIKADFGDAYYNRGLMYFRLGNKEKGLADLSKSGELGILPSYNVLKRMTR